MSKKCLLDVFYIVHLRGYLHITREGFFLSLQYYMNQSSWKSCVQARVQGVNIMAHNV